MCVPSSLPLVSIAAILTSPIGTPDLTLDLCIFRAQGNHDILLHLFSAHNDLPGPGCWSYSSRLRRLPLLYRCAEWLYIRLMHLPFDQRLRRIPVIRGWHNTVRVVAQRVLCRHVSYIRCRLSLDIQEQGGTWPHKYFGTVCRALSHQWHLLIRLRGNASDPCDQHSTRSMATGGHLLWCFLLRDRTGYFIPS